ncbi:lipase 1-like [Sabethes cyaneus]|uniref:lipase 1-like n=1 Tax=Sabethes cyaneus TaxID=53552 RepID=UPI00237EC57A|nr:lipase 1-like [Sabethes cyaneus]
MAPAARSPELLERVIEGFFPRHEPRPWPQTAESSHERRSSISDYSVRWSDSLPNIQRGIELDRVRGGNSVIVDEDEFEVVDNYLGSLMTSDNNSSRGIRSRILSWNLLKTGKLAGIMVTIGSASAGLCRLALVLTCLAAVVELDGHRNSSAPFLMDEEDALLTVPQLIRKYGYLAEEHQVRTEDGYLLMMYRIPARKGSHKRPVFMWHSLFSSCSDWILIGRKHGLGYLLANRNYDVWMGNARGNRYSKNHERFSVKSAKFWDFSFHEIGYYDIPALVDYILEQTKAKKVHFVGFSQGAVTSFIAMSERPGFTEKVIEFQLLSPAVYLYRSPSILIKISSGVADQIGYALVAAQQNGFIPHFENQYFFFRRLCPTPEQTICRAVVGDVAGSNPSQLDKKALRIFLGHFPAGSSVKQAQHYAQIYRNGIFRQYDYGDPEENFRHYGSHSVPRYNLSRAIAQIRTYYSYNDNVLNYLNYLQLEQEIPHLVSSYPVPDKQFGHIDFILANNVKELLYDEVVRNIEKAERSTV